MNNTETLYGRRSQRVRGQWAKLYLFGGLVLGLAANACVVHEAPEPASAEAPAPAAPAAATTEAPASGRDCAAEQQACTAQCKASVPDEASRQPCYNRCLKEADTCAGR